MIIGVFLHSTRFYIDCNLALFVEDITKGLLRIKAYQYSKCSVLKTQKQSLLC